MQPSQSNLNEPQAKGWLLYTLIILLALASFAAGVLLTRHSSWLQRSPIGSLVATSDSQSRVDLKAFFEVWDILDEKFVSASTTTAMSDEDKLRGAIAGLVAAFGDPYTTYFPPSEAERFEDDISGNFSGVGMEVGMRKGFITIISPLPGTPAERAGLLSGDVIAKIDDVSTESMNIDEAVRRIRGEKGSTVTFSIFREGDSEFREIKVVRDTIDIPTVKTEVAGDTFVISLYSFNAVSDNKMEEAMNAFVSSKKEKLIIDVRGNPGGFMQSAVDIASFYLPAGEVVVREQVSVGGEDKIFRTRNRQTREFTPSNLVVLVDNGSASASEILAGALKDHGVATIIGVPTFGKGSVQELVELKDNASVKVTIARWMTPNNVSISDGGLTPDIVIKRSPADREKGLDPQKDAALRFLRGEKVESETLEAALKDQAGE